MTFGVNNEMRRREAELKKAFWRGFNMGMLFVVIFELALAGMLHLLLR